MVISLLADVSFVECRHTRARAHAHCLQLHILICSSGQELIVRSFAVSRLHPLGWPDSASHIPVKMPAILGDILVVLRTISRQVLV